MLSTNWVHRVKDLLDEEGNRSTLHKARLVARGFEQIRGMDYDETSAPFICFFTLRLMLSIVAEENLELHQMDVKTVFNMEILFKKFTWINQLVL